MHIYVNLPTVVLVLVLASPMIVATPKSPRDILKSSFINMLLGFKSLSRSIIYSHIKHIHNVFIQFHEYIYFVLATNFWRLFFLPSAFSFLLFVFCVCVCVWLATLSCCRGNWQYRLAIYYREKNNELSFAISNTFNYRNCFTCHFFLKAVKPEESWKNYSNSSANLWMTCFLCTNTSASIICPSHFFRICNRITKHDHNDAMAKILWSAQRIDNNPNSICLDTIDGRPIESWCQTEVFNRIMKSHKQSAEDEELPT